MEAKDGNERIRVQRFSVTSSENFLDVVAALESSIGHPDMKAFGKENSAARTFPEVEAIVRKATGPSGPKKFMRLDLGAVMRKRIGTDAGRSLRFVVGNPVTMSAMVEHVPDAGSYAPVHDSGRRAHGWSSSFLR